MKFENAIINQGLRNVLEMGYKTSSDISNCAFSVNMLPNSYNIIKISDKKLEDVAFIKETIDAQRNTGKLIELPFVMTGYEKDPNNPHNDVIIDKIEFDLNSFEDSINNNNECSAKYDGYLTSIINNYITNSKHQKPVIIVGHTHPTATKKGIPNNITNCHSFSDMDQCCILAETIQNINNSLNKQVQIATMVVNSDGDFNTIFYEPNQKCFYKIPEINLGEIKLPSFSKGKYFIKDEIAYEHE